MDPRGQARRLSPDRSARRLARAAVHPQRPRLGGRFPLIVEAALRNRNSSFVIDGEEVLLGVDGRSDFNGLHSRKHDDEVEFYAFDMLVSEGDDLRRLPLSMHKTNLARLLARRVDGIHLAPFEQGEIGPDLFRHACLMGLEGLVSKHRESLYRGGCFRHWVKIKNRAHPAFTKAALRVKIMLPCVREFSRLRLHFGTGEP